MNEPQWTYQDIVNHFVKIIGNGTFTVETINESILLKMLDSKGIKIPVEKSYRDIDKDYKMHLQDIGITMNKPQLSAEMREQFLHSCGEFEFDFNKACDFLATALEEQRAEGAAEGEVEGINKAIYHLVEVLKSKTTPALITHIVEDLREALTTKEIDHAE